MPPTIIRYYLEFIHYLYFIYLFTIYAICLYNIFLYTILYYLYFMDALSVRGYIIPSDNNTERDRKEENKWYLVGIIVLVSVRLPSKCQSRLILGIFCDRTDTYILTYIYPNMVFIGLCCCSTESFHSHVQHV